MAAPRAFLAVTASRSVSEFTQTLDLLSGVVNVGLTGGCLMMESEVIAGGS